MRACENDPRFIFGPFAFNNVANTDQVVIRRYAIRLGEYIYLSRYVGVFTTNMVSLEDTEPVPITDVRDLKFGGIPLLV